MEGVTSLKRLESKTVVVGLVKFRKRVSEENEALAFVASAPAFSFASKHPCNRSHAAELSGLNQFLRFPVTKEKILNLHALDSKFGRNTE